MSSPKYLPPSVRYTKARFQTFTQPLFWLTAAVLGLFFFALWQYGQQPSWLTISEEQPEAVDDFSDDVAGNAQLAPDDLALIADIDNLDLLSQETKLKPLQDNSLDFAKEPEDPAQASRKRLEKLLKQKPADLLGKTNSSLFPQNGENSIQPVTPQPLVEIKPAGNLPSLSDLGQRQQSSLAREDNLRRALDSYNTANNNSTVREVPLGVANSNPINNGFNQFPAQANARANPANPIQPTPGVPVTQPQLNNYSPGQPITSYSQPRPNNTNNFNRVNIPNPYINRNSPPNYTNSPYSPGVNNPNYGLSSNPNLATPIPQPYNYAPATPQNLPAPATGSYRTQPPNYNILGNPNFTTPIPQLYNNYGTQGGQAPAPQSSRTNQNDNFLYYY